MVDRGANIDIVFRNGLKDLEVLPPPGLWDNIHPVIRKKNTIIRILSVAAMSAVVVSLSFLTYLLSNNMSKSAENDMAVLQMQAAYPLHMPDKIIEYADADVVESFLIVPDEFDLITGSSASLEVAPVISERLSLEAAPAQPYSQLLDNTVYALRKPSSDFSSSSLNRTFQPDETMGIDLYELSHANESERWSIAAMASPTYYDRFNSGGDELTSLLVESEKPVISYTGGIAFSYKISRRFSIQSGLYYSSMGQQVEGITSYGGFKKYVDSKGGHNFEVLTTNGTVFTSNADVFLIASGSSERINTNYNNDIFDPGKANLSYISGSMRQEFRYLELPVSIRYKVVDKMIDLNLIGGVSYNLLVNNSVYTLLDGAKYPIGETEGMNPLSVSSTLGMGMEYSVSKSLSLNLEPTFRYYLNPFNTVVSSGTHPYSFGIFSGLSYRF
jgi:hypothetical protein